MYKYLFHSHFTPFQLVFLGKALPAVLYPFLHNAAYVIFFLLLLIKRNNLLESSIFSRRLPFNWYNLPLTNGILLIKIKL